MPAFGSSVDPYLQLVIPPVFSLVLSRQQGNFRGLGPNPTPLPEDVGFTSTFFTKSSLLMQHEQSSVSGFQFC